MELYSPHFEPLLWLQLCAPTKFSAKQMFFWHLNVFPLLKSNFRKPHCMFMFSHSYSMPKNIFLNHIFLPFGCLFGAGLWADCKLF